MIKDPLKIGWKKKLAFSLFDRLRHNEAKTHELRYLFWECTLRCTLNCLHCGSDCKQMANVPDMPVEDFIGAVKKIVPIVDPNNTMVVFTGGEALVRKDIEKAGIELYKMGFPWGIVTNGYLMTPERMISLLRAGMRACTVSLDGLKESHNWLRNNPQSFDRAIAAIQLLPKTDLRYDVVTCVNNRNFDELPQIKQMLIDLGIKEWRIFTIFPVGRAASNPELQLPDDKFKAVFDFIEETRKEGKILTSYGCEGFLGDYESRVRDSLFFCRAGINVGSILVDGSISACPDLRDRFIQGNIYKDDFAEVWQNKYQIMRDRSWAKTGICKDCEFFKHCEGNGLHLRNEETNELAFCHLKRIVNGAQHNP
ncbi:MAG: TIGR04133 family radical SAM/SPASM protein [Paludibacteraceae bacterium]|nr:TIGR04133 family radical SAM/SPASM protein [Paludibacteraceae bacterium]